MTLPNPNKTQRSGHYSNPFYRVAPYVQNILDDLSHNNRVRLLRQRFKPAIDFSIRHWPRAVLGVLSARTLVSSYPCFSGLVGLFRESQILDCMRECTEHAGSSVWLLCGAIALFSMAIISVALFEVLSNTVLALRWDKPLRHAEFMFKYSRRTFYIFGIVGMICIPLSWWSASPGYEVDLVHEVWSTVRNTLQSGIELWALRTWLKDLKGEPRTWWGGDKETKAEPKGEEEENGTEGLKHALTR